jgi:AcrR family transcriptional regulator
MKKTSGETREGILAAAYSVLSQRGIEQTTIKEVARLAGVAPGLVHYYFASKDLLLQEVLQVAGQRYTTLIEQMLTLAPRKLAREMLQEPQTRVAEEPEWYRFRYELLAIGLHNEAIAPSARMMLEEGRECIASMIQRITGTGAGGNELSAVLMSCFDGLAIQKIIDPAFDIDRAYKTLQKLLRPVLEGKSES